MLSTDIAASARERAVREEEEPEASSQLKPPPPAGVTLRPRAPGRHCWSHFHKPLLAILVGVLVFGCGTALSLLSFSQVGALPYLLGPGLLALGLMFLVTGLVWLPVLRQSLEHTALTGVNHHSQEATQC